MQSRDLGKVMADKRYLFTLCALSIPSLIYGELTGCFTFININGTPRFFFWNFCTMATRIGAINHTAVFLCSFCLNGHPWLLTGSAFAVATKGHVWRRLIYDWAELVISGTIAHSENSLDLWTLYNVGRLLAQLSLREIRAAVVNPAFYGLAALCTLPHTLDGSEGYECWFYRKLASPNMPIADPHLQPFSH